VQAPAAVVVERLCGQVEVFESEFGRRLGLGQRVVGVPDGDDDPVVVPAELETDLLVRRLPGRVGDEFRNDDKRAVEDVRVVSFAVPDRGLHARSRHGWKTPGS
jgi:hypothetical protein